MRRKNVPLIGSLVAGAHFALFERDELAILLAMITKQISSYPGYSNTHRLIVVAHPSDPPDRRSIE